MDSWIGRPGEPSQSEYLFIYGTLHPEHAPEEIADIVRGFVNLGSGSVPGTLYDLGSYPGAVLDDSSSRRIWGTVFRLPGDMEVLHRLDVYEEFDPQASHTSLFIRRLYPVELTGGPVLPCWIYEYNGPRDQASIVERRTWAQ
jgi:gamma-glutamylcyclotransferase (GGCT)/AIG2-like uncharacterized protein YtfP